MPDLLLAARVTLEQVLIVGGVLFAIGLYIALSKKNAVAVLMGIELMLNAANLALVAFSQTFGDVSKDLLDEIRDELRTSISSSFSGLVSDPKSPVVRSGFGIDFNFRDSSERVFDFNVREFKRAANDEFDQVDKFLFRDGPQGTQDGLVGTLIETLKGLNLALADALDSHDGTGLIVDVAV